MKKSLLVAKDVNYASSIASATVNTALTPDLLRDGALGIYAINPATNKHVLITDGASGTDLLAAGTTVKEVVMYVGTSVAGRPYKTGNIDVTKVVAKSSHYVAPVKQVSSVGYNTSTASGSLNLPATILKGDEALVKIIDKSVIDEVLRSGDTYSGYALVDSDTEYNILASLVASVDADSYAKVVADIVGNGTSTAVTSAASGSNKSIIVSGATPVVTGSIANDSKSLTFTLASSTVSSVNFAVGDFIEIAGSLYKIAALGATGAITYTVTLDRVYKGVTLSGAAASNFKFFNTANPTEHGLTFTDAEFDSAIAVATLGILSSATTSTITNVVIGNGTESHLKVKEKQTWDRVDRIDRRYNLPDSQVAVGGTYDQYNLQVRNQYLGSSGVAVASAEVIIATPTGIADTGGKNQSDLEDILTALGVSFTSII